MPRFMIMLLNGCGGDNDDYSPEITSFRPYDADTAQSIPFGLMEELRFKMKPNSLVLVYDLIDPETWVYPTYSHSDGVDTCGLLFELESASEFEIWLKRPDLLNEYNKRLSAARQAMYTAERERRDKRVREDREARHAARPLEEGIISELLSSSSSSS